jgi:formimidoylglutamase
MPEVFPHCQAPAKTADRAGRFWSSRVSDPTDAKIVLIGMPDDTGVGLNGGRIGAREGPDALRRALSSYGSASPGFRWPAVHDAGNVTPGGTLEETHDRVTACVAQALERGLFPIGIGGGHDLTFPFVRAVSERRARLDPEAGGMVGVYFDAHLDVRDEEGSGMPFRRLVERCGVRQLHVHGLDVNANSAEHRAWFQSHGGHIDMFGPKESWSELGAGADGGTTPDIFVSFDLDVIDQAFAPGVSAMNPCGWSPETACRWVFESGRNPRVACFDIMELCPAHDEGGRTARLAARLLLEFLRGYAQRAV